ncbi:O-antigen ligase family protein [Candidatus Pelagibacter sp.]|nr:O-antigen ligase family protein [Candidatus Pelagibacter sp.]
MRINLNKVLLVLLCSMPISIMIGKAALNFNLFFFDMLVIFFLLQKKNFTNIKISKNLILSFIFLSILLMNTIFSVNHDLSFIAILGLLKNIIFCIGLVLFIKFEDLKKYFSLIVMFSLIFVSINVLLQFFFGEDMFGNSFAGQIRSTAVFGNQIPGSYILKFLFICLLLNFFRKNLLLNLFYFSFFSMIIIITNERMPSLNIIFFTILFLLVFPQENLKKKIFSTISYLILCLLFFNIPIPNDFKKNNTTSIYDHLSSRTKLQFQRQTNKNDFYNIYWIQHFKAATENFMERPFIGTGIKTYRYFCPIIQSKKEKMSQLVCSIHPHNLYFEIASEIGILGIIFFIFYLFSLIINLALNYVKNEKSRYEILVVLFPILILFNPVQITGSIFSTYSGFFYFMVIGVSINFIRNNLIN